MVFDDRADKRAVIKNSPGLSLLPKLQPSRKFILFKVGFEPFSGGVENHREINQNSSNRGADGDALHGIPFRFDPGYHFLDQRQFIGPAHADERFALGYGDTGFEIDRVDHPLFT